MTRPGPIANIEEKDLQVLNCLSLENGVGFNELWRKLKANGHGVSYTTLSNTLKRLESQKCVNYQIEKAKKKIPQHIYLKTKHGMDYQLHLNDKLKLSMSKTRKIVKARKGQIKYNQIILGELPYTCEIELAASNLTKEKEESITDFMGTVGDTLTSNVAETLNQAYSGFIAHLSMGNKTEAFEYLKKALRFKLKFTVAFDGSRALVDEAWKKTLDNQNDLANAIQEINTPSHTELLSCWMFGLLSIIFPSRESPFDLSNIDGWTKLITERSNRIRAEKKLPLLNEDQVEKYLKEEVENGNISIRPIHLDTGIMQFHDRVPSQDSEDSYSFVLGLTSSLKSMLESTTI
jgi:DNA-binding HxlR family transcriptional regulator